jgi:prepilin-type N-terminal cleavage/methylation domain-containing protein/prepilin-type processing-associated H-X9-DG protein
MVAQYPVRRRGPGHSSTALPHGLTLIELIVVVAILAVLAALFLPSVRTGRPSVRRTQCLNNIRNIALALENYKEEYHAYPPAYTVDAKGKPLHSWRTLILPYLDQKALYRKIDLSKPWNDPANAQVGEKLVSIYRCFEADCADNCTTYLALVTKEGYLRPGKSKDVVAGSDDSKTLMVIEVDAKHAVPWMSPADADEQLWLSFGPKSDLPHQGGSMVAFADGHAMFLSAHLPIEERRALIHGKQPETVVRSTQNTSD